MASISINQLGYRINDPKYLVTTVKAEIFQVLNNHGAVVYQNRLSEGKYDEAAGEVVYYGDFSALSLPGEYIAVVENVQSFPFQISDTVYLELHKALLKAFYFQRCGCALREEHAGVYKHDVCHNTLATLYENPEIELNVTGGWHDAGDYGRYVVPAAKAVADLLYAYEFFPAAFNNLLNIPESGNGVADILNEVRYELEWLIKMQDIKTGGVYHKVATPKFPPMIMPEADKFPLVVYAISSPATADFAATLALAARIYQDIDKTFAAKCLDQALLAWEWLEHNPETLFTNKPDIGSGEYRDTSDLDERYWAASELYKTTGKETFHEMFKETLNKLSNLTQFGWADVSGYGTLSYLTLSVDLIDNEIYNYLKKKFIDKANYIIEISKNDGYRAALRPTDYVWGSNMTVLNHAMHLIIANKLEPHSEYIKGALAQWHYLLGTNSLNICFLTGYGTNSIKNPHHRPSEGDGIKEPVPGLVSGGPCSGLRDELAKELLQGVAPAKCFLDLMPSYSTNEITIYWNSPAVFVSAFLNDDNL